jgi:hypothetical protein
MIVKNAPLLSALIAPLSLFSSVQARPHKRPGYLLHKLSPAVGFALSITGA